MADSTKTHLYTEITAKPVVLLISDSSTAFRGESVELVGVTAKVGVPHTLLVRRKKRPYLVEIPADHTNVAELGDLTPDDALKLDADQLLTLLDIVSNARVVHPGEPQQQSKSGNTDENDK